MPKPARGRKILILDISTTLVALAAAYVVMHGPAWGWAVFFSVVAAMFVFAWWWSRRARL